MRPLKIKFYTHETEYWLMLIKESEYGSDVNYASLLEECKELVRMLVSIVKTSKDLYGSKK